MIKIWGITYSVHPLFLILMLISLATGFFIELITLFGIVFIHELGHAVAAKALNWKVGHIKLLPFGGVAEVDDGGRSGAREEIIVALAGPLQNVWMMMLALVFQHYGLWESEWGHYFFQANAFIALFNLLPILPLDGGRIFQSMLTLMFSYHRALKVCAWLSLMLSALFLLSSILTVATSGIQLNVLILGMFLLHSNWMQLKNIPYFFMRFLLYRSLKLTDLAEQGGQVFALLVRHTISKAEIVRLLRRNQYHLIYVTNEKGQVVRVETEEQWIRAFLDGINEQDSSRAMIK